MAGFYKFYVVGGEGGFMGADGVNPLDYILAVGGADRMWFEIRDFRRPRRKVGEVKVVIPAGPEDPNALIDAVLAFDLGRFAECPSFDAVRDALTGVDRIDFDRDKNVPAAWTGLREEARPIFDRMNIWEADLQPVQPRG